MSKLENTRQNSPKKRNITSDSDHFDPWQWHFRRQITAGNNNRASRSENNAYSPGILPSLYSNMKCTMSWDPQKTADHTHHRGIFNFDFSPDGKILVAACEGGSVLAFDPLNAELFNFQNKAHSDCVNCVRFLDSRLFATCSDDTTVALWDARFLKNKVRSLAGHLSWVKNIEYDNNNGLLVTSGFDGCVYTWDINNYSETEPTFRHVFHTSGLMRSKLTSDCSKLVISLSRGYIIVIHDLDLLTLEHDLHGFKPNMYRLIQMSGEMPIQLERLEHYNQYFHRTRNRVEFITDFPVNIDAEIIASLQIHPQSWCILSRSTTSNEKSEWTCVHDIQQPHRDGAKCDSEGETAPKIPRSNVRCSSHLSSSNSCFRPIMQSNAAEREVSSAAAGEALVSSSGESSNRSSNDTWAADSSDEEEEEATGSVQIDMAIFEELFSSSPSPRQVAAAAAVEQPLPPTTVRIPATSEHPERLMLNRDALEPLLSREIDFPRQDSNSDHNEGDEAAQGHSSDNPSHADVEFVTVRLPSATGSRKRKRGKKNENNKNIVQNDKRLVCFAEEPNVGRGFIKELCFSSDGRLVCSPFGFGVRLLAFNSSCAELCDCVPDSPVKMYEVASAICHSNVVVTTKFSPVHSLLVTGCLSGKASFCQPVF